MAMWFAHSKDKRSQAGAGSLMTSGDSLHGAHTESGNFPSVDMAAHPLRKKQRQTDPLIQAPHSHSRPPFLSECSAEKLLGDWKPSQICNQDRPSQDARSISSSAEATGWGQMGAAKEAQCLLFCVVPTTWEKSGKARQTTKNENPQTLSALGESHSSLGVLVLSSKVIFCVATPSCLQGQYLDPHEPLDLSETWQITSTLAV